jgi:hypothetical protein
MRQRKLGLFFACLILALAFGTASLNAQEMTKISGKITATYTKQDSIVVGDVAGHTLILGISEGTNVNAGEHEFMDGARAVNMSFSDLTQGNGIHRGHVKFTKNGDVIYAKWEGKVTTVQTDEGDPAVSFEGIFEYTKGEGKFENIKGNGAYKGGFTSETEYSVEWQAEYIIEK